MAETVTPTEQTKPLDVGTSTSEYALSKWVAIAGVVIAVLSGVADVANQLAAVVPGNIWITKVGLIAGTVAAVISQVVYANGRAKIKSAALAAGKATTPTAAEASAAVRE